MKFVNTSPVPADFDIVGNLPGDLRAIIFTAKATFRIEDNGQVKLERESPFPLLKEDQPTELGLHPRDNLPRLDPVFEVMLLGKAYAPDGQPTTEMKVALSLGDVRREIDVIGDRSWQGEGEAASISQPEAFESMPLTWERAFGGSQKVLIDSEAELDVSSPMNVDGKGFDHISQARGYGDIFNCPEGYPQFDTTRALPNLELPDSRVRSWDDAPLPACWAPVPLSSGLLVERYQRSYDISEDEPPSVMAPEVHHRAHPDWVIETPAAGAVVQLEGASSQGTLVFRLPELRVVAEFQDGDRVRKLELFPKSLVLLAEERRFYLTYKSVAEFVTRDNEKRTACIKLLKGWCPDMAEQKL